jgi:hypothetical protein
MRQNLLKPPQAKLGPFPPRHEFLEDYPQDVD